MKKIFFSFFILLGVNLQAQDISTYNTDTLFSNGVANLSDSLYTPFFTYAKDYESAITQAQKSGKPVLIYFSGFGCVNNSKMEDNFFIDPSIQKFSKNKIVVITLMVDDRTKLPAPIKINNRTIRNIGNKNAAFQVNSFRQNSQPFLVFIDKEGKELTSIGYRTEINEVKDFLNKGLRMHYGDQYEKK